MRRVRVNLLAQRKRGQAPRRPWRAARAGSWPWWAWSSSSSWSSSSVPPFDEQRPGTRSRGDNARRPGQHRQDQEGHRRPPADQDAARGAARTARTRSRSCRRRAPGRPRCSSSSRSILTSGRGPTTDSDKLEQLKRDNPTAVPNPNWDPRRLWLTKYTELDRSVKIEGLARDGEDIAEFMRRLAVSRLLLRREAAPRVGGGRQGHEDQPQAVRRQREGEVLTWPPSERAHFRSCNTPGEARRRRGLRGPRGRSCTGSSSTATSRRRPSRRETQQTKLKKDLADVQQVQASYLADATSWRAGSSSSASCNKALPAETEAPAFLSALQQVANVSGVDLKAWQPMEEQSQNFYAKFPMKLEIDGPLPPDREVHLRGGSRRAHHQRREHRDARIRSSWATRCSSRPSASRPRSTRSRRSPPRRREPLRHLVPRRPRPRPEGRSDASRGPPPSPRGVRRRHRRCGHGSVGVGEGRARRRRPPPAPPPSHPAPPGQCGRRPCRRSTSPRTSSPRAIARAIRSAPSRTSSSRTRASAHARQVEVVLGQYSIDELKPRGHRQSGDYPRAMLVDPTTKGWVVKKGDYIGRPGHRAHRRHERRRLPAQLARRSHSRRRRRAHARRSRAAERAARDPRAAAPSGGGPAERAAHELSARRANDSRFDRQRIEQEDRTTGISVFLSSCSILSALREFLSPQIGPFSIARSTVAVELEESMKGYKARKLRVLAGCLQRPPSPLPRSHRPRRSRTTCATCACTRGRARRATTEIEVIGTRVACLPGARRGRERFVVDARGRRRRRRARGHHRGEGARRRASSRRRSRPRRGPMTRVTINLAKDASYRVRAGRHHAPHRALRRRRGGSSTANTRIRRRRRPRRAAGRARRGALRAPARDSARHPRQGPRRHRRLADARVLAHDHARRVAFASSCAGRRSPTRCSARSTSPRTTARSAR